MDRVIINVTGSKDTSRNIAAFCMVSFNMFKQTVEKEIKHSVVIEYQINGVPYELLTLNEGR